MNIRPLAPGSPPEVDSTADVPHQAASETASALVDEASRIALPGAAEVAARTKSKSTLSSPILEPPAPESILSAPMEGEGSASATNEVSELASGTETLGEATIGRKHRGSEVKDASLEEIKKFESASVLQEDPAAEAVEDTTTGVQRLKFDEPEKTQEQDAKGAADAATSVGD